jgi:Second Messenger Oligonucleotide or Dinucleotide Synthetase domain
MASTIDAGFNELLSRIRATSAETAAAKSHRASIEAKLVDAYGMTSFFRIGSFGNGTSVAGFSDVDFFAVIPPDRLKPNSRLSLALIAGALRQQFPNTGVRINGPAIHLPFGVNASEATEVVPVYAAGSTTLGFPLFVMPDGAGGWKFSAPESHNEWVQSIDDAKLNKVKPLIRFLKAWKFYRNVPISSFYLEIRAAEYARERQAIDYPVDLCDLFGRLADSQLFAYPDPWLIGETLRPCATENQRVWLVRGSSKPTPAAQQWPPDDGASFSAVGSPPTRPSDRHVRTPASFHDLSGLNRPAAR